MNESGLKPGIGDDIRLPKLSHVVAGRLRDQIVSGKLQAGSMLLPENKLLELFNVSRPTLREALRILEAESLISIGRGMRSGATVLGPSMQKAAEYTTFMLVSEGVTMLDLHEARMFFEPTILRSLDGERLREATERLRSCVDDIQQALTEGRYLDVVSGTNRFHDLMAFASGNKTISLLLGMLQTISDEAYAVIISTDSSRSSEALQKNMGKTVAGYTALCEHLESGNTEEASAFWQRYMERARDFLIRSKIGERRLVRNAAG